MDFSVILVELSFFIDHATGLFKTLLVNMKGTYQRPQCLVNLSSRYKRQTGTYAIVFIYLFANGINIEGLKEELA